MVLGIAYWNHYGPEKQLNLIENIFASKVVLWDSLNLAPIDLPLHSMQKVPWL